MPNNQQQQQQQQNPWWGNVLDTGVTMLGGMIGASNQHRRQRELMDLQQQHQMALNRQGHDLQYDMWKKTSYPAQLKMMKAAGLSPGLMYGGGAGAGGSTGSQGGGSAAGGAAAAFQPMDMSNMMMMDAQRDLLKAQEDKTRAEEKDILDTLPGDVRKLNVEADNIVAETREIKSRELLNIVNAGLTEAKINLTYREEELVVAQIKKTLTDKRHVDKILEMDYSDTRGRNYWLNLERAFLGDEEDGAYEMDDYLKGAIIIGGASWLKRAKSIQGAGAGAINKTKQLFNWVKKKLKEPKLQWSKHAWK